MPLRSRLILFAVTVLLLFLFLATASSLSLLSAAGEAEDAREELAKLDLLERLERCCGGLGSGADPVLCERARAAASTLSVREWAADDRVTLARLLDVCREACGSGTDARAVELRALVSDLRQSILSRAGEDLRAAEVPAHRRAVRLLVAAVLIAGAGSAVFVGLYLRLGRERRTLEDRLHRSEKLSALATLAAGVSHELNNPLGTIAMSAEALGERLPAGSEEAEFAASIVKDAARCQAIVADLSDLARGSSLDREAVDAAEVAQEAVRSVSRSLPPGITLGTELADGLPLVSADRGKLLQLLENLLRNSVEAVSPSGRILLCVSRVQDALLFVVSDDGRGIPRHLLSRIFEPFFTDRSNGVGLGLTICHRIAELHGGDLRAESPGPGRGATFTFRLPLEADHA